jgi:hypothetical protein
MGGTALVCKHMKLKSPPLLDKKRINCLQNCRVYHEPSHACFDLVKKAQD